MSGRIIAIIQARMSSSRLPGKVLMDIAGKPLLQHMLERVRKAKSVDDIILATTTDPSDDTLVQFCKTQNFLYFRGSLHDVLDRFYQAAQAFQAEVIVRLTGDCPLIDPTVLDLTVNTFLGLPSWKESAHESMVPEHSTGVFPYDFATNRMPPPWKRTLPIGLDVEVCSFNALQRAWKEAHALNQREHVMPYLYDGVSFPTRKAIPVHGWYVESGISSHDFNIALLNHAPEYGSLRWTVDTPADLEFVRQVIPHFEGRNDFGWQDVLDLLEKQPDLVLINADVKHKSAFDVDERQVGA